MLFNLIFLVRFLILNIFFLHSSPRAYLCLTIPGVPRVSESLFHFKFVVWCENRTSDRWFTKSMLNRYIRVGLLCEIHRQSHTVMHFCVFVDESYCERCNFVCLQKVRYSDRMTCVWQRRTSLVIQGLEPWPAAVLEVYCSTELHGRC